MQNKFNTIYAFYDDQINASWDFEDSKINELVSERKHT